jgi:type IV secretory pathway VirB4 component
VLSGRERTVRLMEQLIADVGDAPAAWLDEFMDRAREHMT